MSLITASKLTCRRRSSGKCILTGANRPLDYHADVFCDPLDDRRQVLTIAV